VYTLSEESTDIVDADTAPTTAADDDDDDSDEGSVDIDNVSHRILSLKNLEMLLSVLSEIRCSLVTEYHVN